MTSDKRPHPEDKERGVQEDSTFEVLSEFQDSPDASAEVTVCVSLFNYEAYIESCLDSVAAQTLPSLDLIIVDDASTDAGRECVANWLEANKSRFLHSSLMKHTTNQGLPATRNTAIRQSRSEYVFILDADNELRPRCLEALLNAAGSNEADFAYSIIEQFGDIQGLIGTDAWSPKRLARGNYIDAMALLRRDTWETVGGYRKMKTPGWEDFDFWCRCVEAELHGVLVPEILCRYRVHSRSMLRQSTDTLLQHIRVWDEVRRAHPWIESA